MQLAWALAHSMQVMFWGLTVGWVATSSKPETSWVQLSSRVAWVMFRARPTDSSALAAEEASPSDCSRSSSLPAPREEGCGRRMQRGASEWLMHVQGSRRSGRLKHALR